MDIATVIGIIAGFGLIFMAIVLGGSPLIFVNVPSMIIVIGGTMAGMLISFPLSDIIGVVGPVRNAFFHTEVDPAQLIKKITEFATIARREGILALESHAGETDNEFLSKSIQLAIDGTAPELIKDILTTEVAFMEDRHSKGQAILATGGALSPAFGMIGTLIGLVQMLATMDDPSTIGAGMAVALLTTLYGAILANVAFIPVAGKLKVRTAAELLVKEIVIEGILSIQSGDNPRVVEQKLKAFIAPSLRESA
ncbi:MAG: MotA/TolQ/ExbB proton channel family protein [Candidatus Hydrogenedentes bacterium]|nr:MotA/TolQ/ExbB proton channel family protein [Candidatus Hydrogenedentota bacterium]